MAKGVVLVYIAAVSSSLLLGSSEYSTAQNAVKLFGSTHVRSSTDGTSSSQPNAFNSATVSLTCDTSAPIHAVLSSTPDGTGNVLVDNYINVTVSGATTSGPANVCRGGNIESGPSGEQNNCFNATYRGAAMSLAGEDLDSYAATGGVPAIDVSSLFVVGVQQAKIDLADTGTLLTNASLYLVTSCTQAGVTGPAKITGNPISGTNPSPDSLNQDYDFNSTPGQIVGFSYDLTTSQQGGHLETADGTIPNTSDSPLDPALWQTQYAKGTSFATSSCLQHKGEQLNGTPACKLYTLTCQVGTGATEKGALCPVSQVRDEVFHETFTGPVFTLPDIVGPNGKTYHQGVGFLMAGEGWTGGPCGFDPASGLQAEDCPQNLLTTFSSSGIQEPPVSPSAAISKPPLFELSFVQPEEDAEFAFSMFNISFDFAEDMDFDGTGTHPNSTFISVAQVPEDLTTVTVQGAHAGWVNSHNINVGLSSEPPVLPDTIANHENFVASPIRSITYGVSPSNAIPNTKFAVPGDVTLTNSSGCPAPGAPPQPASLFAPPMQAISVPADGQYALHYFAQDCAGTQELRFVAFGNGGWSTTFYTAPINVDTVAPLIPGGLTTSPKLKTINGTPNSVLQNQPVTVSYRCTDDRSGVATCGGSTFGAPGTLNTGVLTSALDTSTAGIKTFTVQTTDFAGNPGTPATLTYNVVPATADLAILQLAPRTVKTGSLMTYDLLAVNFGPNTASGVKIKDVLPAGVTFVSAGFEDITCALFGGCKSVPQSNACTLSGNMVVCDAGQLNALSLASLDGVGVQIVVKVTASANSVLSNTANVSGLDSDPNQGNNTSTGQTAVRR
jgi:uncharacterized repeat protein (TIGR01451 family)